MKHRALPYAAAVLIVLFALTGWCHHLRVERAYANAFLVNALSEISLAETSLRLLDQGRVDTARQVLKMRSESALGSAEEMSSHGARMHPFAWPNLHESLRRASERARYEGKSNLADRIDILTAELERRDHAGGLSWFDSLL